MLSEVHNISLPSDSNSLAPAIRPSSSAPSLIEVIGDPARWAILRELAPGTPLSVQELAERIGKTPNQTSKHLTLLRGAGAVIIVDQPGHDGRKQFHTIAESFRRTGPAGQPEIDYGPCLLRFP